MKIIKNFSNHKTKSPSMEEKFYSNNLICSSIYNKFAIRKLFFNEKQLVICQEKRK